MNYRWIVIENSLKDKKPLNKYKILSETIFGKDTNRESRMLKVEVPEGDVTQLSDWLKENIEYPYYTHLYNEDPNKTQLIIIFSGQKLLLSKVDTKRAVEYGLSHDVSKSELGIKPREVAQETW